jgi:peroxiredoxin
MKKLVGVLALLIAGAAFAGVQKGQRAPEFSLPSLSGSKVALSSLRGKVVVVDFWAHWCEPCKKELPQLDRLGKQYAQKGVVVLAVNIDEQRGDAERMVKQLGVSMDVLLDPARSVAGTYDLPKMPTSFVIDKKGLVRYVNAGFDGAKDVDRFKQELDELTR